MAANDELLLDGAGLVRAFGDRRAVDRVDVRLAPGQRLSVVGPNGAGKSTLLRILATLLRPDAGTLRVVGASIPKEAQIARQHIGYLGHDPMVYLDLTAHQNLELFADLYGIPDARERIPAALGRVGLLARTHDPVRTFSRGMAQRLGIARLTLHEPRLLLLDEPYTGLDVQGARLLDEVVEGVASPQGMVMVTHELDRALALTDQVLVLRAGRPVSLLASADIELETFRADYQELTR